MYGQTVFVNPSDTSKGSRSVCDFKCLNCSALIKKEVRNANDKHRCSSYRNNKTEKWCSKCSSWLELGHFHRGEHAYGGYSKVCRSCRADYMLIAENKRRDKAAREYKPTPTTLPNKKASAICHAAQYRAKRHNCAFNLDLMFIQSIWESQNTKCWYSGLSMKISKKKVGFYSPSLDRLNPDLGYVKGNVVLCLFAVNSFKQELTVEEFVKLLATISWRQL
jgi:hypothetical protein